MPQYGYIFNLTATTVAVGADVLFSNHGKLTGGITHTLGGAGITFTIAGDYRVLYSVSTTESCQFALFKNGTLILGTTYGSGAGTQQNIGQAILTLDRGDVITRRNHNSAAAVGLQTLAAAPRPIPTPRFCCKNSTSAPLHPSAKTIHSPTKTQIA